MAVSEMSRTSMRDDLSALYSPQERRQVTPSRQRVVRGGAAREDQRQRPESRPSSDGHPPMATKAAPNAGASASPAADASAVRAAYDIAYRKRFGFVGGHRLQYLHEVQSGAWGCIDHFGDAGGGG